MENKHEVGTNKGVLDVIITQENIDGKTYYVAQGIQIEVASQGLTLQEALENIKDAAEIVLENYSEDKEIELTIQGLEQPAPIVKRIFL